MQFLAFSVTFLQSSDLKVHYGKIVAEWLSEHKDEIELFFTSPYSPEINLDEYLVPAD